MHVFLYPHIPLHLLMLIAAFTKARKTLFYITGQCSFCGTVTLRSFSA